MVLMDHALTTAADERQASRLTGRIMPLWDNARRSILRLGAVTALTSRSTVAPEHGARCCGKAAEPRTTQQLDARGHVERASLCACVIMGMCGKEQMDTGAGVLCARERLEISFT
jgi:hypothetical protein